LSLLSPYTGIQPTGIQFLGFIRSSSCKFSKDTAIKPIKCIDDITAIMYIIDIIKVKSYVMYMGWCDMLCPEKEASS
jgi:hypothetical protein